MVNIAGIDKAELLANLYNNAKILGLGVFGQAQLGDRAGKPMTKEQAREEIDSLEQKGLPLYFDYLHGKVMKVDISGDELNTNGYNRDNGDKRAETIISQILLDRCLTQVEEEKTKGEDPSEILKDAIELSLGIYDTLPMEEQQKWRASNKTSRGSQP